MSDQAKTESKFVNVDLEQWRRDIDTFAAATTSALDAIIGELSIVCSGGKVNSFARSNESKLPAKRAKIPQQGRPQTRAVRTATDKSTTQAASGSRLASLKEKLASRINKG